MNQILLPALQTVLVEGSGTAATVPWLWVALASAAVMLLVAVVVPGERRRVQAGTESDSEGKPCVFTLTLADETVALEAGRPWVHVDRYKWVTRGLIEAPQSFHVLRDGTVEINGEKIRLADPDGAAKLELEVNKRHPTAADSGKPATAIAPRKTDADEKAAASGKVRFKVRVDHLGHLMIDCLHHGERVETGLRGLTALIQNGLMLKPRDLHLGPLQKWVELDGVRFECNPEGAQALEIALNTRYAPTLSAGHAGGIEIKENPASPTGFDIHFATFRAGARFEVKGHMTQEPLDTLQDQAKCELLQPGIVLRLSPPHLLVRRKRPDGGEEKIPDLPDLHYLRTTARQLQEFLNHPRIRRSGGAAAREASAAETLRSGEIKALNVVRHSRDEALLWLEVDTIRGGKFEWRALTHHNMADLQHAGVFRDHLDVNLSLDHRTLSILDTSTQGEQTVVLDPHGGDGALVEAGRMLTASLKPLNPQVQPSPAIEANTGAPFFEDNTGVSRPGEPLGAGLTAINDTPAPTGSVEALAATPRSQGPPVAEMMASQCPGPDPPPAEAVKPAIVEPHRSGAAAAITAPEVPAADAKIAALFSELDPLRINSSVFASLAARLEIAVQDVRLSLPRVFEDRRFEILPFEPREISSVLELRAEDYSGFYLAHIGPQRIDFVYANAGLHLEWGTDKCVLQPHPAAEAAEFRGAALLGMAQSPDNHFVFVVTAAYREWVRAHESRCREAFAVFATVTELAAVPDPYNFIWPEA